MNFVRSFILGLSLFPLWKWLHQNTCPHMSYYEWGMGSYYKQCDECGRRWTKKEGKQK